MTERDIQDFQSQRGHQARREFWTREDYRSYMQVFEESLIRNCAPTLAGIKPGNLFLCQERLCRGASCYGDGRDGAGVAEGIPRQDSVSNVSYTSVTSGASDAGDDSPEKQLRRAHCKMLGHALSECRQRFGSLGLKVEPLARRNNGTLIYVYRPELLSGQLNDSKVAGLLESMGYNTSSMEECLRELRRRMRLENTRGAGGATQCFPHEIGVFLGYPFEDVIGFIANKGANCKLSGCWKAYSNEKQAIERFGQYKECTKRLEKRHKAGKSLEILMSEEMFLKGAVA